MASKSSDEIGPVPFHGQFIRKFGQQCVATCDYVLVCDLLSTVLQPSFLRCHLVRLIVVNEHFIWWYRVDFKILQCISGLEKRVLLNKYSLILFVIGFMKLKYYIRAGPGYRLRKF